MNCVLVVKPQAVIMHLMSIREKLYIRGYMRELTYYVACSVDGFIAHADGSHAGFSQDSEYFADLFSSFPETVPSHNLMVG
jgi:hypothetical protein